MQREMLLAKRNMRIHTGKMQPQHRVFVVAMLMLAIHVNTIAPFAASPGIICLRHERDQHSIFIAPGSVVSARKDMNVPLRRLHARGAGCIALKCSAKMEEHNECNSERAKTGAKLGGGSQARATATRGVILNKLKQQELPCSTNQVPMSIACRARCRGGTGTDGTPVGPRFSQTF